MSGLKNKNIILGITGSIAAYKSALLTRLLVKEGASVQVIMTEAAKRFIAPLTLSVLSKRPVLSDLINQSAETWNNHVELAEWADAIIIAPASANTIAKCAQGLCDNLLQSVYLSARSPVFLAPAMDFDMYQHPSFLYNINRLKSYHQQIIDASSGELASGLTGEGRMAEPEEIVRRLQYWFARDPLVEGKKVLITAGPTREAIDAVRYISNSSSGKMGFALAEVFARAGAQIHLVNGTAQVVEMERIKSHSVISAKDMYETCEALFPDCDLAIFAAAVADYTPKEVFPFKIKKKEVDLTIELTKTVDIAESLGRQKKRGQMIMGFALETDNEEANAKEKLVKKNFDFIVLNSLNDAGAGFAYDTNRVTVYDKSGGKSAFELKSKKEIAEDLLRLITREWSKTKSVD